MKLVYRDTQDEVKIGDEVTLSDKESVIVEFFREPHKSSSSGKVCVRAADPDPDDPDGSFSMEYYVGVIGAHWIDREDQ